MQFKNILATICAFSVAGTIAGPVPAVEGSEIAERAAPKVDANVLQALAQDAKLKKKSTTGAPPTEQQIQDLMKTITGNGKRDAEADADASDLEKRWYNPYWNQYNFNYGYNGFNYNLNYYCGSFGNYCYYPQYNYQFQNYNWYGLNGGYYYPLQTYYNNAYSWNYYGYNW